MFTCATSYTMYLEEKPLRETISTDKNKIKKIKSQAFFTVLSLTFSVDHQSRPVIFVAAHAIVVIV